MKRLLIIVEPKKWMLAPSRKPSSHFVSPVSF
jgi:hypothetical protein